jgi:hypothetical protein
MYIELYFLYVLGHKPRFQWRRQALKRRYSLLKRKKINTTYKEEGYSETRGKSLILLASMLEIRSKAATRLFKTLLIYSLL